MCICFVFSLLVLYWSWHKTNTKTNKLNINSWQGWLWLRDWFIFCDMSQMCIQVASAVLVSWLIPVVSELYWRQVELSTTADTMLCVYGCAPSIKCLFSCGDELTQRHTSYTGRCRHSLQLRVTPASLTSRSAIMAYTPKISAIPFLATLEMSQIDWASLEAMRSCDKEYYL